MVRLRGAVCFIAVQADAAAVIFKLWLQHHQRHIEHILNFQRLAERGRDGMQRAQFAIVAADFFGELRFARIEAGIVDGRRRGWRQQIQHAHIGGCERAAALVDDFHHADEALFHAQRRGDQALRVEPRQLIDGLVKTGGRAGYRPSAANGLRAARGRRYRRRRANAAR